MPHESKKIFSHVIFILSVCAFITRMTSAAIRSTIVPTIALRPTVSGSLSWSLNIISLGLVIT